MNIFIQFYWMILKKGGKVFPVNHLLYNKLILFAQMLMYVYLN